MAIDTDHISFCHQILPRVSRTFAIGIGLLQQPLKHEICVAYLICRILDTLEDSCGLPSQQRASLLNRIAKEAFEKSDWTSCIYDVQQFFYDHKSDDDDCTLCLNASKVFEIYHKFPDDVQKAMKPSLIEMALGMAQMVKMEATPNGIALNTIQDLEQYCYYIAGTAGILLTNLFGIRRQSISSIQKQLSSIAVAFGRGLQLTNIIKDMEADARRGVVYIPKTLIDECQGGKSVALIDLDDSSRYKLIQKMTLLALNGLDQAISYTLMIPVKDKDIRMFCGLPILFAVKTLGLILECKTDLYQHGSCPELSDKSLKISRQQVTDIYQTLESVIDQDRELMAYYKSERPELSNLP